MPFITAHQWGAQTLKMKEAENTCLVSEIYKRVDIIASDHIQSFKGLYIFAV